MDSGNVLSTASSAPLSSAASRSLISFPMINASSTSWCKSTPRGRMTCPAPGSRIDVQGFRKKKGCFGRALFSSATWSLYLLPLAPCSPSGRLDYGGKKEDKDKGQDPRVVPPDADQLAGFLHCSGHATYKHFCPRIGQPSSILSASRTRRDFMARAAGLRDFARFTLRLTAAIAGAVRDLAYVVPIPKASLATYR